MLGLLGPYPNFPEAEGDSHFVLSAKGPASGPQTGRTVGRRLGANKKPTHQQDSLSTQPGRVGSGLVELLGTQVGIGKDLGLLPPRRSHSQ